MPQHPEIHCARPVHACLGRTRTIKPAGPLRSPRRQAVFPARAGKPGHRVEAMANRWTHESLSGMVALVAVYRPAMPTAGRQRSRDLIQVASPIHTQLTA